MNETDKYTYTYSAKQRAEIESIRKKYLPQEEDAMTQLRRLDRQTTRRASAVSIALGTISCLVMGTGMSMTMVWAEALLMPGILVGLVGMAGVAAAYPVYRHIEARERAKIAPEILRMTEALMR